MSDLADLLERSHVWAPCYDHAVFKVLFSRVSPPLIPPKGTIFLWTIFLWTIFLWPGILAVFCGAASGQEPIFADRTAASGLVFEHDNGMTGKLYFPEIMGAGGALFDYDGDGDLDVYLVQGGALGPGVPPSSDRLFRNDLDGDVLRFTDVTADVGLQALGYGMGAAAGDYDSDGDIDLYVTNLRSNQLLRNDGGTFTDVTRESGTDDRRWSVPALFFDYDRDGDLDLYVGNYVDFSFENHRACLTPTVVETYCSPSLWNAYPDRLLKNRGDGTFEDVTALLGLDEAYGPALGAVAADFDGDGWLDLYVANDGRPNQLWLNGAGRGFRDEALLGGCAVNEDGRSEGSMGVDAGDFDGDGDPDLFMTHLDGETHTLYRNAGDATFDDVSVRVDLAAPTLGRTGFGAAWLDYDGDGHLDLLAVNGAVKTLEEQFRAGDPHPYHQPNQLFRNRGDGRFVETSAAAGTAFAASEVSRGALFGDLDNDGDTDVVVTNNHGPARLLRNRAGRLRPWLGLRLLADGRDALGARVALLVDGKAVAWRRVGRDGSYASSRDPRVLLALPPSEKAGRVRVHWLSGRIEEWDALVPGRYTTLREGEGAESKP